MVRESLGSAKPPDRWTRAGIRRILPARRDSMDPNVKKTTLRMIPYGLYVLTAAHKDGRISAGTVNWVTQASFEPPLVVVGVKTDSAGHALIKDTKAFALNVLGKGQQALAFTFFKPAEKKGDTISGEPFRTGKTGAPILASTPAFIECSLETTVEMGDHSIFVGKVVEVGLAKTIDGRADDATLWMKELGDKVFYGG
jgi:flavin reductase (DIM6/NTAB) family NADH-FMN oxidoreductase RutF